MIIQWCIKGMWLPSDAHARRIIDSRDGLICNWWRKVGTIRPNEICNKLTDINLDFHVNHFDAPDPTTGLPFCEETPFISLTSGAVERDAIAKTNYMHSARRTALWFGTEFGSRDTAYLFTCWLVVAPRPAVEVESVGEEVRDLNVYRRYSDYQTEGEVVAKINLPANHIRDCQKWTWNRADRDLIKEWQYLNPRFTPPESLSNIRELI
ncbi:hypothetical protein OHA25_15350 [Nonomuraea sp. NBC_00507]|uniref:hypothetical protein n=1 Tax=Nonomuraea sp. NBC_00507 TaxID=2976002 RepID=UPI002E188656